MWPEPLSARAISTGRHTVDVIAVGGEGRVVAVVPCAHNAAAGWGSFGEMRIVAEGGGPRQRVRALALLVREALRYAEAIGVTHVRTEAPPRLAPFAARLCGFAGEGVAGRRHIFTGELQAARTVLLGATDMDGRLRNLTDEEEREIDGAISVRR